MSILKSDELTLQLEQNGFVVIDAGLLHETELLETYISANFQLSPTDFYYSLLSNSPEQNLTIRDRVREILTHFYETCFTEYRTVTESFLSKPAQTAGELMLHQDWCYTDEKRFAAYNLWIPLVDVDETNGALFFLRGSHRWFGNLRSSSLPTARIAGTDAALGAHIVPVPLKRGQVLVFHPGVFHGSFPNGSGMHRTVVTATVMGNDAPFLYYHRDTDADEVSIYRLPDETFLGNLQTLAMQGKPEGEIWGTMAYTHRMVEVQDLQEHLGRMAYDQ